MTRDLGYLRRDPDALYLNWIQVLDQTNDPLAGFLPQNRTAPEGDGAVVFTVKAKPGQPTGAEIRNKARIVFDTNTPIDTNEYLNTIDNSLPVSHVMPLAAVQSSIIFNVSWTVTDTGSGIQSYDVFRYFQRGAPLRIRRCFSQVVTQ